MTIEIEIPQSEIRAVLREYISERLKLSSAEWEWSVDSESMNIEQGRNGEFSVKFLETFGPSF